MIEFLQSTFTIPPVMPVLSYALGTGIFIGLGQWSRAVALGNYDGQTLWSTIGAWMVRAWIVVILFSLSIQTGLWQGYKPANAFYAPELLILSFVSAVYLYIKLQKHHFKEALRRYFREIAYLCAFLFIAGLIWLGTVFVFMAVNIGVVKLIAVIPALGAVLDPVRDAVMVSGALWLFPFIYWYQKAEKKEASQKPGHYKFHHILWPIVVGLFFFILPLFIEKMVTSEKYHDMLDAKPPLERV